MSDLKIAGLTKFQEKLQAVEKKVPDRIEDKLDKLGKDLRKSSKEKTPDSDISHKNKLNKKYKLLDNEKIPGGWQKKMTNTAPHFHLAENGHRLVKDGKEIGFVEGKHMVERSVKEMEETMPDELNTWLDELFKELN